jgi:hypothetical protein
MLCWTRQAVIPRYTFCRLKKTLSWYFVGRLASVTSIFVERITLDYLHTFVLRQVNIPDTSEGLRWNCSVFLIRLEVNRSDLSADAWRSVILTYCRASVGELIRYFLGSPTLNLLDVFISRLTSKCLHTFRTSNDEYSWYYVGRFTVKYMEIISGLWQRINSAVDSDPDRELVL